MERWEEKTLDDPISTLCRTTEEFKETTARVRPSVLKDQCREITAKALFSSPEPLCEKFKLTWKDCKK